MNEAQGEQTLMHFITRWVPDALGGIAEIKNTEENCGTLWIDLKDGSSYFLTVEKCQRDKALLMMLTHLK